jgi:hypothetical protein
MAKFKDRFEAETVTVFAWDHRTQTSGDFEFDVPVIPDLNQRILAAVEKNPILLDMRFWHRSQSCGTTHCIAGWAVTVAGRMGRNLEQHLRTELAAELLFKASLHGEVPDFYAYDDTVLNDLRERAAEEAAIVESARLSDGMMP